VKPASFVEALADIRLPNVFNPYAERCDVYDRSDAPRRRRANLRSCIQASVDGGVDTIWIARDLGYRGGRRTGVPLTDEVHLEAAGKSFGAIGLVRATTGPPVAERTAAIVWEVIARIGRPVFLWNVFPLHPYAPGDHFSNRCHTRHERELCRPLLIELLSMLSIREVIAIGRDAQTGLAELGIAASPVRHPSYGGQSEFISGLCNFYKVLAPSGSPTATRFL
jgi:uracil-DNA glycosylase